MVLDSQYRLLEHLSRYDAQVRQTLRAALEAGTGLDRVRALHNRVEPAVVVHDFVLESTLCPMLDELPGGRAVADALRSGCRERARLLGSFETISRHVAAHNVYPVSGEEVERVLEGLAASLSAHARDETPSVVEVLAGSAAAPDAATVASAMSAAARRARTRVGKGGLPARPGPLLPVRRLDDRIEDWIDTHWNWIDPAGSGRSPRRLLVDALKRQANVEGCSARSVLEAHDAAVDAVIAELDAAGTPEERARAARRIAAAVTLHDSVIGGVLCPVLATLPGGPATARRLLDGCRTRAELRRRWDGSVGGSGGGEPTSRQAVGTETLTALIGAFREHEREGTLEVASLLDRVPASAYRTRSSPLDDVMWPWHSEGGPLLALRMALWAESAPTRPHPTLLAHPSSRALRSLFHALDHFGDYWGDAWIERWFLPELPDRPSPPDLASVGSSPAVAPDGAAMHGAGTEQRAG